MSGAATVRFTPENGVPLRIGDAVGDVVISVGRTVISVILQIDGALTTCVQLVGADELDSLRLEARDGSRLELVSTTTKFIRLIEAVGVSLSLTNIVCDSIRLGSCGAGFGSVEVPSGQQLACVEAAEGLWVSHTDDNLTLLACRQVGAFDRRRRQTAPHAAFTLPCIIAPSLHVAPGQVLQVTEWQSPHPAVLVAGDDAAVRVLGSTPRSGITISGTGATLEVVEGVVPAASGEIGTLSTTGSAIVRASQLWVHQLRCGTGAAIDGIEPSQLDASSLAFAAKASTFGIVVPRWTSWRSFSKGRATNSAWRDPSTWRQLCSVLEAKGSPLSARWARTMERDVRRSRARWASVERWVLEVARVLGYGERLVRPLLVHLIIVLSSSAVALWLSVGELEPALTRAPSLLGLLFFSPIGLVNGSQFVPGSGDGPLLQAAWLACALSGSVCFATSALAARRTLAYG